ncbi:tyrosine-type recombinase/integrase [Haloferax massiliensis]|uniref:Tyrosine recombinase XerC n=1 Tax=Haloferax massiliensis TaxID=1476858 RepID=A0A0D6JPV7_9EURY|nr:site-specific integrase [Haloferax massiliensis]CQR49620.1 Tyrosine recombinase XerC [Haloferax massiliensis]
MVTGPFDRDERWTFPQLNSRQQTVFRSTLSEFERYLRSEGRNPRKRIGYADKSVETRVSRVLQVVRWLWEVEDEVSTEINPDQADRAIEALDTDEFRRRDGERYFEGSKRKISNALVTWFEFRGVDWEPKIVFRDEPSKNNSDPFTREEVRLLYETSLTYKSIPKYNDLTPDERDRWYAYLAQELGKPKADVRPADWNKLNENWKIPSLIATEKAAAWRPALVGRMRAGWYDPSTQAIVIPGEYAVKNDSEWRQPLPNEAANTLEWWLEQRSNIAKYDDDDHVWLNRKGNPYSSQNLNYLLRNLMEEAGISERGRKLTWYSFRHTLATYTYEEYRDLKIVAETLRQNSTESAARYVHPTDEMKREVGSIL